jgi:hypothetical protein
MSEDVFLYITVLMLCYPFAKIKGLTAPQYYTYLVELPHFGLLYRKNLLIGLRF